MMDDKIFYDALEFAIKAHEGVVRKSVNTPFILHPMEVANIVASITENREVMAAAFLHDCVEDANIPIDEIREKFGDEVALLVESETEDKRRYMLPEESWQIRKEESLEILKNSDNINVKILWLADKLSNMRSFYRTYRKKGNDMWKDFHQGDPKKQEWYYRSVAEYTKELDNTYAYHEFNYLIDKVFGGE